MLTKDNIKECLLSLGFKETMGEFSKYYEKVDAIMALDYNVSKLIFPEKIKGRERNDFYDEKHKENLVVFECVDRLLEKGYRPEDIELEKEWHLGHDAKSGRADICVNDSDGNMLFIIECKTFGKEYEKALKETLQDGGQLVSYWQQERSTKWLLLYSSDYSNGKIIYKTDSINCSDDNNIILQAKKDDTIRLFSHAKTNIELYQIWDETYDKKLCGDVIFNKDTVAYQIGIKPLKKKDLKDFTVEDKIVNRFEEILRHNNVSDKENAFNRLVALFICKLVDEINKKDNDELEFQYKIGTDTYESLQDRLQRLHRDGMEKFMKEKIFYIDEDYPEKLVTQYTGQKRKKMIADLHETIRILKFYTNNDFAFKDVHNEELFFQNGKILVEIVELFQNYRIIGSNDIQFLGDLFEQLLNKGFKQNEGQFFTPIPITHFIWNSLPLDNILKQGNKGFEYPKVIDYACGAGHFITEGFQAINDYVGDNVNNDWVNDKLYGIEKDYRLARVSKISLFMHGAGNGNIIFGDGLENYKNQGVEANSFDILVANPPYSIKAFKQHLKLKNNKFSIFDEISIDGSEIETLFVERIAQLLKPNGIAAVLLPSSILNKDNTSFISAREIIINNFKIISIVSLGSKTFSATGTPVSIFFLEKYDEPPKRLDLINDSVDAIFQNIELDDFEDENILKSYCDTINVKSEEYIKFITRYCNYSEYMEHKYFGNYINAFKESQIYIAKIKQKSFNILDDDEKEKWFNDNFFTYAIEIEKEKLLTFSLVYNQKTLIVRAPFDIDEEKKMLGYTWSKRRGQEGIQIIKDGGRLYNPKKRFDETTISGIIHEAFNENDGIGENSDLAFFVDTKDMFDFSRNSFNKAMKTIRTKKNKNKVGYKRVPLTSENFSLMIGDRVIAKDMSDDGEYPVYSANVYEPFGKINKLLIKDFDKPSILWGIDGDWMVNMIEKNIKFYPTDHCGVLRLNTETILPEYARYALLKEGEYEMFNRNNRASIDRVSALSINIPSISIQKEIINNIKKNESKINENIIKVNKINNDIIKKFKSLLNSNNLEQDKISKFYELQEGKTPSRKNSEYWNNDDNKWISIADMSLYDRLTENTSETISDEAVIDTNMKIIPKNTVIMSFKLTIGRTAITSEDIYSNEAIMAFIPITDKYISLDYLRLYLSTFDWNAGKVDAAKGQTLNQTSIGETQIKIPNEEIMKDFDEYIGEQEKIKKSIVEENKELRFKKANIINEHFE